MSREKNLARGTCLVVGGQLRNHDGVLGNTLLGRIVGASNSKRIFVIHRLHLGGGWRQVILNSLVGHINRLDFRNILFDWGNVLLVSVVLWKQERCDGLSLGLGVLLHVDFSRDLGCQCRKRGRGLAVGGHVRHQTGRHRLFVL